MRCWYSGNSGSQETGRPSAARQRSSAIVVIVVFIVVGERLDRFLAIARQQHFDFLLRSAQRRLALARERNAALESLERLFERHVALFEFRDERFEFGQAIARSRASLSIFGFDFTRATLNVVRERGSND